MEKLCWRRVLRIYPLFIIAILIQGLFQYYGYNTHIFLNKIHNYLGLSEISGRTVFWSIPVELKYYLVSPIIIYICHRFLKWSFFKVFLIITISILFGLAISEMYFMSATALIAFLSIFLVGTVISIVEVVFPLNLVLRDSFIKRLDLVAALIFVVLLVSFPFYSKSIFGLEIDIKGSEFRFPYAVLWGIVLVAAKFGTGIIKKIYENKLLRFYGVISYSLYLLHIPDWIFLNENIPSEFQMIKIYLFFITCIVFSLFMYLFVERPLSKVRWDKENSQTKIQHWD